jgi:lipoprotein NlpD
MLRNVGFLIVLLISLIYLAGCAGARVNWDSGGYTVRAGDTLYSIAWRYEIDPDDLVKWNQLSSPYIIHPGNRLRTWPSNSERANKKVARSHSAEVSNTGAGNELSLQNTRQQDTQQENQVIVRPGDTLYSLAKQNDLPAWKLARMNGLERPYVLHPGQTLRLKGSAAPSTTYARKPLSASIPSSNVNVVWRWPVRGKIIGRFNGRVNNAKGIDIAGKRGVYIKAAAPGKVVYSGNSLINYGHLVIIKHSQNYLSAYANNRKLLVKEGDKVKAGQNIAELGESEAKTPFLHFEIRKKGKPVDPMRYLPSS